jgi:2-haloacid dehalogenase
MMFAPRIDPGNVHAFTTDFIAYRFDKVLGDWKPYAAVIKTALRRGCTRWGLHYHDAEAQHLYEAIPTGARTLTSLRVGHSRDGIPTRHAVEGV